MEYQKTKKIAGGQIKCLLLGMGWGIFVPGPTPL